MKERRKNGKQKKIDRESPSAISRISGEALRGVSAIFFIAIAGFLVLASFEVGGAVGSVLYEWLSWLLGVGYMLLPLSLLLLSIIILRSFERHFGAVQLFSMAVFLFSALALVNLAFPGKGGVLGSAISRPLVSAVDTTATVVFLLAFVIAALIIAFDIHLGAAWGSIRDRFRKNEESDDSLEETDIEDVPVVGLAPEEEETEVEVEAEPQQKEEPKKNTITSFLERAQSSEGFPIIAATGSTYTPPPVSILAKNKGKPEVGDVKANMNIIKRTLQNFGIQVEMDEASIGPTVTRYSMKPAEGVRLSKIVALQSNLELALAASPVRIEAPIPGKSLVGVEVPNISRTTLGMAPLITDDAFSASDKPLLLGLGRSITGQPHYADLARMPHLLVAGTTGAGKSVAINDFVISLLYRCGPERLRFIMVDPKRVELTLYNSIPHLLTPVITDAKKAILAIKWLAKEMERRYNILETEQVRDIASYHENVVAPAIAKASDGSEEKMPEAMPYIVLIIDELADIMSTYPRELESGIVRLAQMSRAVGIHLILSTQRPSVKVITGLIKANIPARVALQVASQIDSRTILDTGGAEKLLGAGDMLFLSGEMSKPRRIQAPYISEDEVKKVVAHIAKQSVGELTSEIDFTERGQAGGTDAIFSSMIGEEESDDDELYPDAKRTVIEAGKASTSYLQRKLGIGYARAARLMDLLEERGVIGPADGAKPRDVIGAGNADELVEAAEAAEAEEENR
ncbi:MAG: DNA translocase FtsK [Candidatus Kaiserbacteria bacterium]|nr:MAG: DNA translocase FtsK [Candidatus Kaiserbacteria bacterium]